MRARGPRFAWWVIPPTLVLSMLLGAAAKLARRSHHVDPDDLKSPAGYERTKISGQRAYDRYTLYREFAVLGRWAIADASRGGGLALGRLDDVERIDADLVSTFERKQRERAGSKFVTHLARLETIADHQIAHLELTDADMRLRIAVTRIGDETLLLVADSSERDDVLAAPFAAMLDSLVHVRPRPLPVDPGQLGDASGRALVWGLLACLPLAFAVSVRRRRAWERAQADRAAPAQALAAGPAVVAETQGDGFRSGP